MQRYELRLWRFLPAILLLLPLISEAMPATYRFQSLLCTDTCYVSDLNDRGDIVMTGFGDVGGATFLLKGTEYQGSTSDRLPGGSGVIGLNSEAMGVIVSAIDNQGNMAGQSGGVPTVWVNGIAYDKTDPANAGLPSPTQTSTPVTASFLNSLSILNAPAGISFHRGLENAAGHIAVAYNFPGSPGPANDYESWGLLTHVVPEPSSSLLFAVGLGCLMLVRVASERRG
ncbi:MAG TPA: PEP-CTERM sorting domain-containing protein [Rhodocyclaceae bacterium]|nr:PEP-CTERM sorting domain-containing protein [Rhodocyclaceae bacterium]